MKGYPLRLFAALALGISTCLPLAFAGKANDTLVWATDREATAADPYYDNIRELVVIGHTVWDGLLFLDLETGAYQPLLATAYEWVDNVTLDFTLRPGVVFHDGSSFDADDVVYTVNFVADKSHGVLTWRNVSWMKSAEKLGPLRVRLHLHKPFPAALAYLAQAVFMMPDGHYDTAPTKADGNQDFGAVQANGTGPYRITEFKLGESITMSKNERYFQGSPKGQPPGRADHRHGRPAGADAGGSGGRSIHQRHAEAHQS